MVFGRAQHVQEPIHEAFELAGACIALGVAMLLLLRLHYERTTPDLLWMAAGLAAMGLIDGVHAVAPFGASWAWLRHLATLTGGLVCAMVWVPPPPRLLWRKRATLLGVAAGAVAVSAILCWWSHALPAPWDRHGYTLLAKLVNTAGGAGFLAAALFFFRRRGRGDLVFASFTLLFATASFLFSFSRVWGVTWWLWHGLRLLAYIIVLGSAYQVIIRLYRDLAGHAEDLEGSVAARTAELTRSEAQLLRAQEGAERLLAEQKQSEQALKESEQRYRSFIEASAQVIWRTNPRGEVDQPIPSWSAYTGQSDAEAAGFGWTRVIHPDDRAPVAEAWETASAARGLYRVEYRLRRHDGQWRHILARGVPVLETDGRVREYIGTCIDITEQRDAEAAVQKQARLIDLSPAATMVRALDGTITFWSEGAERLYGWTRAEALGRRSHDLLLTEFSVPLEQILQEVQRGGKWSGELRHAAKTGARVVVDSHWLAQFGSKGELVELLESNLDITERKRVEDELRRLKDELELRVEQRTAELAAANKELEAFGYSVSHDLRAPLRHIDSYINMLQRSAGSTLEERDQRYIRIVADAAKRMGNLIDDLLVLSRLGRATIEEQTVDLRRLVDEARQELAPAMAGRAIDWRVGPLPLVCADANLLRSAVTNLLDNAIKYTRERNPAVVEVGSREQDGEMICYVRDNGAGFDMRFADQLFGVFQRLHTAQEFEGTGIGLASVRRVVQRHGGRTWAEGEPGRGATFYFSLPQGRVVAKEKEVRNLRNAQTLKALEH